MVVLETSSDLLNWSAIQTNRVPPEPLALPILMAPQPANCSGHARCNLDRLRDNGFLKSASWSARTPPRTGIIPPPGGTPPSPWAASP
jgi:hypothetical protein